jgi:hypothetical protein
LSGSSARCAAAPLRRIFASPLARSLARSLTFLAPPLPFARAQYWNGGEGAAGLFCSRNYTPAWFDPSPASGDDLLLLCDEGIYFGNLYNDRGADVTRGTAPADYMTSVLGNRTLDFLRNATARGDGKPFAAYFAPHAPHLPATPAPWHADAPVPAHAPRPANWNTGWEDKHFMVDNGVDKPMSQALINGSDNLHASRLRTLMSVDDALRDILALLDETGAADNTVVVLTSDHGYRLGQASSGSAQTAAQAQARASESERERTESAADADPLAPPCPAPPPPFRSGACGARRPRPTRRTPASRWSSAGLAWPPAPSSTGSSA